MSGHSKYEPKTGFERWLDVRLPIVRMAYDTAIDFPTPKNLNYWWTFGGILAVCLVIQIITGVTLAMPLVEGQAFSSTPYGSSGVLVRGVREADLKRLPGIAGHLTQGSLDGFDAVSPVVSNSLPIWLSMNGMPVVDWQPITNPVTLYPSFLVPGSLVPPFAAVHIDPNGTRAIASAATLGSTLSHAQLASDKVRITTYGLRNAAAQDLADFVAQFSLDTDLLGITNMPIVRDEKRTQVELGAIGQKKVIDF